MRIGIDMFGDQTPSRQRGIGRYTRELVSHLIACFPQHAFFLYYYSGLPGPDASWPKQAAVRIIEAPPGAQSLRYGPDRLAWQNPDEVDALLISNPFEAFQGYQPPRMPVPGLKLAAVFYDLIPFLFPTRYLENVEIARAYQCAIRAVRQYDVLLSISEATRVDILRSLRIAAERVVSIGAASDGTYFCPDRRRPVPPAVANRLRSLGIDGPFVFSLSGMDDRKNFQGLMAAFSRLPTHVRTTHQLVLTCLVREDEERRLREAACHNGIASRLVLTNFLDDDTMRLLYQRCAAFVFPSRYEGFGLPILEAMHCGAPVLAGDNSSQPEVVGDAGLLANVDDPGDLARQLAVLLQDESLAESLREKGPRQAAKFSWKSTAARAMAAIEEAAGRPTRHGALLPRSPDKPRLAFFSPLPPCRSGIADYSVSLLDALLEHYTIDVYHDSRYLPDVSIQRDDVAYRDHRMFSCFHQALNYRRILYHLGNAEYHGFVYDTLLKYPGVVVLHDLDYVTPEAFLQLVAATDVGINLRRPPTNGETSAALLNLLSAGVPTIVTDVDAFASWPDNVVYKLAWHDMERGGLRNALSRLASDASLRERIGRDAKTHIRDTHSWCRVAGLYAKVIEEARTAPAREVRGSSPSPTSASLGGAAA